MSENTIPPSAKDKKYLTLENGTDFRTIARIMSELGFKMNHATARNQLNLAMHNLLMHIAKEAKGTRLKSSEIDELLLDQAIHDQLGEILYAAFHEETKEIKECEDNE